MIGAGLVAKKAIERGSAGEAVGQDQPGAGLQSGDRLPQSDAGLQQHLDQLGFNLVGYGCTTCIGNSGPLPEEISAAVEEGGLVVASVLSGNRNFEGRINPDVRANYLASPPLVVAYALAGRVDIDLYNEPLGERPQRPLGLPEGCLADDSKRSRRDAGEIGAPGDVPEAVRERVRW